MSRLRIPLIFYACKSYADARKMGVLNPNCRWTWKSLILVVSPIQLSSLMQIMNSVKWCSIIIFTMLLRPPMFWCVIIWFGAVEAHPRVCLYNFCTGAKRFLAKDSSIYINLALYSIWGIKTLLLTYTTTYSITNSIINNIIIILNYMVILYLSYLYYIKLYYI